MPVISYLIEADRHYCYVLPKNAPDFILKMKSVGAKSFGIYEVACSCDAGYILDEQGFEEPCDRCAVGRATYRHQNGVEADPVF